MGRTDQTGRSAADGVGARRLGIKGGPTGFFSTCATAIHARTRCRACSAEIGRAGRQVARCTEVQGRGRGARGGGHGRQLHVAAAGKPPHGRGWLSEPRRAAARMHVGAFAPWRGAPCRCVVCAAYGSDCNLLRVVLLCSVDSTDSINGIQIIHYKCTSLPPARSVGPPA